MVIWCGIVGLLVTFFVGLELYDVISERNSLRIKLENELEKTDSEKLAEWKKNIFQKVNSDIETIKQNAKKENEAYKVALLSKFETARTEMEENHLEYRKNLEEKYKYAQNKMLVEKEKYIALLRREQEIVDGANQKVVDAMNQAEEIIKKAKIEAGEIMQGAYHNSWELTTAAENIKINAIKEAEDIKNTTQILLNACDERVKEFEEKEKLFSLRVKDIPVLASYFVDIEKTRHNKIDEYFLEGKRPAPKKAELVRALKEEKILMIKRLKEAEYKLKYYESIVPWLVELEDEPIDVSLTTMDVFNNECVNKNNDDAVYWLTPNEYSELSSVEKYQLALDRYIERNKSNSEIGKDYERYIGYKYERDGYEVEYRGIVDGLEDKGRDLLCYKDDEIVVVQCKCWSSKKEIHENHINQLFGTTVKCYLEKNPDATFADFVDDLTKEKIKPLLITTTNLSKTAKDFAAVLGVQYVEGEKIVDYPMIKCNISRVTKEKIYHLPFDQQYDKVKIDEAGEFYAMTVREAEDKGFRRAKKWHKNENLIK